MACISTEVREIECHGAITGVKLVLIHKTKCIFQDLLNDKKIKIKRATQSVASKLNIFFLVHSLNLRSRGLA